MRMVVAIAIAGWAVPAAAQEVKQDVTVASPVLFHMQAPPSAAGVTNTFEFVRTVDGFPGRVVKGAPYSATAVTESVQTLADGTRISNQISAFVARDSEGRTRREQSLGSIGPWASDGEPPKTITIDDPAANVGYLLFDRDKTARKMANRVPAPAGAGRAGELVTVERQVHIRSAAAPAGAGGGDDNVVMMRSAVPRQVRALDQGKSEQLGQRNIEGVIAEGTRTRFTIEAGVVGNDRPIEVVDERWYSPELQVTVLSKHSDPRMGETTYRLTKISRAEPPRTLFEVPPDYKMVEAGEPIRLIRTERK